MDEPTYLLLAIGLVTAVLLLLFGGRSEPTRRVQEIDWIIERGVAESRRLADEAKQDMDEEADLVRKRRSS